MADKLCILETIFRAAAVMILVAASYEDIKEKKISVIYLIAGELLSIFYASYMYFIEGADIVHILGGLIPGTLMVLMSLVSSSGIGMGDGLMILCLGPVFGMELMSIAVVLAFLMAAGCCILLLTFRRIRFGGRFAFMPFLTAGAGVMLFAGI